MASKSAVANESLSCVFCSAELNEASKVIPECGSSICSGCYYDLAEEVDGTDKYKCMACKQVHTWPQQGLQSFKRPEKPLSDTAKTLRSVLREVEDRLAKLRSFDSRELVQAHCDKLEHEVREAVESAVRSLNKFEKDMLEQISRYREQCLSSVTTSEPLEIAAITRDVQDFSSRWNHFFDKEDAKVSEKNIRGAIYKGNEYIAEMSALDFSLKNEALNRQMLVFAPNLLFFNDLVQIGELKDLMYKKEISIESTSSRTFVGHSDFIRQVLFLQDGRLVSCSEDATIKIWNTEKRKKFDELVGHNDEVCSMVVLLGGLLASGSRDKTIRIWNIAQKKQVRILKGHTRAVVCLQALANDLLASYSLDDTIKIWNPYIDQDNLLSTIKGHRNVYWVIPFGVLSNGNFVTCSRAEDSLAPSLLKIWDPSDGRLVKWLSTRSKEVSTLLVLTNDQVAVGLENGSIIIFDFMDRTKFRRKDEAHVAYVVSLVQLSNENLVSCGDDGQLDSYLPTIKIWSLLDLSLLQTIPTTHKKPIYSLGVSHDEKYLASAGRDCSIKLWPITVKTSQQT